MADMMALIKEFQGICPDCGREHDTAIEDVQIGTGLVHRVGEILQKNGFPGNLLLVADRNTLRAAEGILDSLSGFVVETLVYDDMRVARMEDVEAIEVRLAGREIALLSVGTGSLNDPCRLAAARQGKKLCLFATAPSMDGFASYSAPIVKDGFKSSYPAKSPEVIIGDTRILAAAPAALKSAGFGDMIAKYIGLVDWQIAALLTEEPYCARVAALTRHAVDTLVDMAHRVTAEDEETAGEIFRALLLTGIGMSFMQNSRPASGSEHVIAHLLECIELREGLIPNYHGEDVGVCTLLMCRWYEKMARLEQVAPRQERVDWEDIYAFYGDMAADVRRLNQPQTVTDDVDPADLAAKWPQIREIIRSIPSYDDCYAAMKQAGCKLTVADIGKAPALMEDCIRYSPFMRRRLTLLRLRGMIE